MKKLSYKGFTAVEGLLIVLFVALIAGIGYYVFQQSQKNDETSKPAQSLTDTAADYNNPPKSKNVTELKDRVVLYKVGDEEQLPDDIPASFKAYMKTLLAKNTANENNCISGYSVARYSKLNIDGGTGSVDAATKKESKDCFGGAHAYWYLQGDDWKLFATQGVNSCGELDKTTIYEEFLPSCIKESDDTGNVVKNPNGSIDDALAD